MDWLNSNTDAFGNTPSNDILSYTSNSPLDTSSFSGANTESIMYNSGSLNNNYADTSGYMFDTNSFMQSLDTAISSFYNPQSVSGIPFADSFQQSIYQMNQGLESIDTSIANEAKTDDKGMVARISDGLGAGIDKVKSVYGGMDDMGKEFIWKAAAGTLGALATASSRAAQAKAQSNMAKASMMNAETSRLNYQLSADEKAKDRANAANVWNGVKSANTQYEPVGLLGTNMNQRMGI